jgi:2-polyprenyl-6-methoxyphenol hydroxylase-like FAD-dependent oxidoreductase
MAMCKRPGRSSADGYQVGPCVGIARARLEQVLLRGASGVPYRLATSITSLAEYDRSVSVWFTDGSTRDYDLVVGADGIHSVVRDLAFGAAAPNFAGQMAWRSLAPIESPPNVQFFLGAGCFFGLCAVGGGYTYGFGNFTETRQPDPVNGRLQRLRSRFAAFGPSVRNYLDHVESDEQVHCSPIEWIEQQP